MEEKLDKMRAQQEAAAAKEAAAHSKQLKAREIEVSQLENMHASVKAQLEQRVAELESKLSKARGATRQADLRRAREAEGFASDITLLRQQLMAVDRTLHQMRLQSRLQDDERLDGLLRKVQAKGGASQVCFEPSSMQISPGVYDAFQQACMRLLPAYDAGLHQILAGMLLMRQSWPIPSRCAAVDSSPA